MKTTKAKVIAVIRSVAHERGQTLSPLSDDAPLFDCGLDSLALAIIVARLDDEFAVDPFANVEAVAVPKTLGDFFAAYERATGAGATSC